MLDILLIPEQKALLFQFKKMSIIKCLAYDVSTKLTEKARHLDCNSIHCLLGNGFCGG